MNPLREESSFEVPDEHYHPCEECRIWIHHWKSKIQDGEQFVAHKCPRCKMELSGVRVAADKIESACVAGEFAGISEFYFDYYGH